MLAAELPTLAEVAEAFAHWRRTRTSPRTPDVLQQQTVGLLSRYRVNEVLRTLGLCHKSVKRWKQRWLPELAGLSATEASGFVALPMVSEVVPEVSPVGPIELKLTRQTGTGVRLSLEGSLSKAQWHWALRLLEEEPAR